LFQVRNGLQNRDKERVGMKLIFAPELVVKPVWLLVWILPGYTEMQASMKHRSCNTFKESMWPLARVTTDSSLAYFQIFLKLPSSEMQIICPDWNRRKTLLKKIKDGNPFIKSTRQMRTQVDTTQRKKQKQTINKN
jgi:hypothetical protein